MDASQNRPRSPFLSFILEAAKLFGIAIVCLLIVAAVVIVSAKTGIVVPARWFGLLWWTTGLVWIVFKRHKGDVRREIFWLALSAILVVHVTAFAFVLHAYPAWREIWFMFVFLVEGPLVLVLLENVVQPRRNRKHV